MLFVDNQKMNFFVGLFIGSLLGLAAMMLMAPRSGQETREQIQQRSLDLKDQSERSIAEMQARIDATAKDLRRQIDDVRERLAKVYP